MLHNRLDKTNKDIKDESYSRTENWCDFMNYLNKHQEKGIEFKVYNDSNYTITQDDIERHKSGTKEQREFVPFLESMLGTTRNDNSIIKQEPDQKLIEQFYNACLEENVGTILQRIEDELSKLKSIDKSIQDEFKWVFRPLLNYFEKMKNDTSSERKIKKITNSTQLIRWSGEQSQLKYLINELISLKYINTNNTNKLITDHFDYADKNNQVNLSYTTTGKPNDNHDIDSTQPIKWLGDKTQLIYLIDELIKSKLIRTTKANKLITDHFVDLDGKIIVNVAQSKDNLANTNTGKPKDANNIDSVINGIKNTKK